MKSVTASKGNSFIFQVISDIILLFDNNSGVYNIGVLVDCLFLFHKIYFKKIVLEDIYKIEFIDAFSVSFLFWAKQLFNFYQKEK